MKPRLTKLPRKRANLSSINSTGIYQSRKTWRRGMPGSLRKATMNGRALSISPSHTILLTKLSRILKMEVWESIGAPYVSISVLVPVSWDKPFKMLVSADCMLLTYLPTSWMQSVNVDSTKSITTSSSVEELINSHPN